MTGVKICGITTDGDARAAVEAGADAIGFVFAESSPRRVVPARAAAIDGRGARRVGVFVDPDVETVRRVVEEAALDVVQLHGNESPGLCAAVGVPVWKRFDVRAGDTPEILDAALRGYDVEAWLFDPGAGSGRTFTWSLVRPWATASVVAGGLDPDNVGRAVRTARPWFVDVSSGVELAPGRKDPCRMRAFVEAVRREDRRGT
jgi:phosphoribosylanthranilate isomerase